MTRGLDCNNPLDIMISPADWVGKITPTRDPQKRLETFDSIIHGIRAGALTLINYQRWHGINTITGIIQRFAPPNENPTNAYADYISQHTGFDADAAIDLMEADTLTTVTSAIIHFEQGVAACEVSREQIAAGIAAALHTAKGK